MNRNTLMHVHTDVQEELNIWRNNVITKMLRVAALIFTPVLAAWIIKFPPSSVAWQALVFYLLIYLTIIILAIFKKIDTRVKAWGLVLLSYLTGTMALILGGLAGDGRVYYLTAPIIALLLISVHAGMVMAGLCLTTYFSISLFAHAGLITNSLIMSDNSLLLSTWIQEGVVVAACLALIMSLQKRHSALLTSLATEKTHLLGTAKESENRYRLVSELISDIAYAVKITPDGDIEIEWATEVQSSSLLAHPRDFFQGQAWQELVYSDDIPSALEMMQRLFGGETDERELRIIGTDEEIRWIRNYARPEWDKKQNRVVRVFGAMQDITSQVQAEEKLQQRNKEISRLYRASEQLIYSETPTPEYLAEAIARSVLDEFGKSNCSLLLVEKNIQSAEKYLKRVATVGPYAEEASKGILTLDGAGIVPKVIRSGELINVPNVMQYADYVPNWKAARSEMAIPLKVGDDVIGAIDVQSSETNAFNKDDERLMSIFANRAASALENARLYKQTREQLRQITALRNVDNAIIGAFDLRPILNILLEEVTTQLNVDAAGVLLYNPHMQTLDCADRRGFHTAALKYTSLRLGEGYAGKAATERRMIHVKNIFENKKDLENSPLFADENFNTYFGVPLIAKGELKGVLEIFHRAEITPSSEWMDFLETFAGQAAIAIDNATLFDNLQRSNTELLQAYDATLEGWVKALDMRDRETEHHTQRVTNITLKLAREIGINDQNLIHIRRGALLHDIGKMGIPDDILTKQGPLTDDEMKIMRQHPHYARHFISQIDYLRPALDIPFYHHEKWDGTGYPQGLKGKEIPLAARIFAIADVWDALTSNRPYREAWSEEDTLKYIKDQSGKHFDPKIVEAFLTMISKTK